MPDCDPGKSPERREAFQCEDAGHRRAAEGKTSEITDHSGSPTLLTPAFSFQVIIAENIQVRSWRDMVNLVVAVGEYASDLCLPSRFLRHVVMAINRDPPAESVVSSKFAERRISAL